MPSARKKLVVIGDGTCGKTCLLTVFAKGEYPTEYLPTVFEVQTARINVKKTNVRLTLCDTAGQDDYDRLRPFSYNDSDVILICFSVDSPDSLVNVIEKWAPEAKHYCPRATLILVGTKSDMRMKEPSIGDQEDITSTVKKEDANFAKDTIGAACYLECSALKNEGVQKVFETAVKLTLKKKNQMDGRGKTCTFL